MRWINYYVSHTMKSSFNWKNIGGKKVLEDEGTVQLQKGLLIQEEGHSYTR